MQESEVGAWENGQAPSQEDLSGNPKGSLLGDGCLGSAIEMIIFQDSWVDPPALTETRFVLFLCSDLSHMSFLM